jgi:hypothetical protein
VLNFQKHINLHFFNLGVQQQAAAKVQKKLLKMAKKRSELWSDASVPRLLS